MVDLHHHLLPGLDDGSPDLPTSLEMARLAVADGITHIVCTPHASSRYAFNPEAVLTRAEELRVALEEANIKLQLGLGCDFHLSYDNIQDAVAHPSRYSINGGEYLLIELPDYTLSPNLKETFYELRRAGLTPILTHPERNPVLQREPQRMLPWLRDGLLTQVTAGSITGNMGKSAQRIAERMLANRWVHFIATDAHDPKRRPPQMRAAREIVSKRHGTLYADLLCRDNPMAVFKGRSLGEQEEGVELFDSKPFKERWYHRLFRA
ncbi:MAG TPA: CpsB/CapC family capsule biosynthesis tyrosine phosphatase [Acidobacteriaceae bacterium]|nr:CpsB/CapC family capsule biosynthesis tyrosine phosphatase [Acidobacteriaceae bacterium]